MKNILENEIPYYAVCLSKKSAHEILVYTNMVEIFETVGIDYCQGPEKGVAYQCFSQLFSTYEATMGKNEQCRDCANEAAYFLRFYVSGQKQRRSCTSV